MQDAQPRRRTRVSEPVNAVRVWWCRLLDGAHPWGSFDAMVGRYGLRRYRLTVFPPGISTADRRLLRLWRGWPVGGGVIAMLAVMLLGDAVSSAQTTVVVATATYLSVGAVLFVLTTGVRAGVRSVSLILLAGVLDPGERRSYAEWERLVDVLTRADSMLKAGAIDPTQHEALWWQAYDRLGVSAHA
jgi:Family of unknown function (DUF6611)